MTAKFRQNPPKKLNESRLSLNGYYPSRSRHPYVGQGGVALSNDLRLEFSKHKCGRQLGRLFVIPWRLISYYLLRRTVAVGPTPES
jgi:hypothetical protein